jgi:sorting and assembly machinery component 37
MLFELHIWGPAFGLPSIESQCLATVAYFIQCVPPTEWQLIPSSDTFARPTSKHAFCFCQAQRLLILVSKMSSLH